MDRSQVYTSTVLLGISTAQLFKQCGKTYEEAVKIASEMYRGCLSEEVAYEFELVFLRAFRYTWEGKNPWIGQLLNPG